MLAQVIETENQGKAVVASEQLSPGQEVLRDKALLVIPVRGSERDDSPQEVPSIISRLDPQMWTDWWYYKQLSPKLQEQVLNLYAEMNGVPAQLLRTYLFDRYNPQDEDSLKKEDLEEFTRLSITIMFNAVEMHAPWEDGTAGGCDYGHAVFETACRLNHSCRPNCFWFSSQDGQTMIVRATSSIPKGDQLTVDYVSAKLRPLPERRALLMESKNFDCQCCRCRTADAGGGDETRRFPCASGVHCPGVHFMDQPHSSVLPKLLDCTRCGKVASRCDLERALQSETDLRQEIQALEAEPTYCPPINTRIRNLEPPHALHHLAARCNEMKAELYESYGQYPQAAQAYGKAVECRKAILGEVHVSDLTAFTYERWGDALRHVDLYQAQAAYQHTVHDLQCTRGPETPYSLCAAQKLAAVQRQLSFQNKKRNANCEPSLAEEIL